MNRGNDTRYDTGNGIEINIFRNKSRKRTF